MLIPIPLRTAGAGAAEGVQKFDNEFHAKLDLGLAEADKNQALFKQGAQ